MLQKENVFKILERAAVIDEHLELFGSGTHRYKLNPVISNILVRRIEEKYGFTLPEDYFRFITEIGDGGACVDYGLMSFSELTKKAGSSGAEYFCESYRKSLSEPFCPRKMLSNEIEDFGFAKEAYEKSPNDFFVLEYSDDDKNICYTKGFLVLGTHGCQGDYGMVVTGKFRGKIFDTDNEGGFSFIADSFDEFYQKWLDGLEENKLRQKLSQIPRRKPTGHQTCYAADLRDI